MNRPSTAKELLTQLRDFETIPFIQSILIILNLLEVVVVDISQLQADVAELQAAGTAAANELATLASQIVSLQAAGPGSITQADLDELANSVSGVTNALKTATASAGSGSGTAVAGGGTASPTTTGGTTPAPEPPGQSRPVYTFDGDPSTVNVSSWPPSGEETTDTPPKSLFFFSGDAQNVDGSWPTNGDGQDNGQWHVYTGATQPSSSPATGTAPAPGAEAAMAAPGAPTPRTSSGTATEPATSAAPATEVVEATPGMPGQPPQVSEGGSEDPRPGSSSVSPGG